MSFKKAAVVAAVTIAATGLVACTSTGGNTSLNSQAITAYSAPQAKQSLPKNREVLMACVAHEAAKQRLGGANTVDASTVAKVCEPYELAYRTSVMAHVRPEWQRPEVLQNTANTATGNLYQTILGRF